MTAEKAKVNHGRNLFLLRKESGKKQLAVANDYGCKQERISQLESQENISDDVLQWFADYYGRTLEEIRDTEIELKAVPMTVNNNTYENGSVNSINQGSTFEDGSISQQHNTYHTDERILRMCEEKDKQIEQLFTTLNTILELDKKQREEMAKLLGKK